MHSRVAETLASECRTRSLLPHELAVIRACVSQIQSGDPSGLMRTTRAPVILVECADLRFNEDNRHTGDPHSIRGPRIQSGSRAYKLSLLNLRGILLNLKIRMFNEDTPVCLSTLSVMCCGVLRCVAVCCSALKCVAENKDPCELHVLRCAALCCSVLQCVEVCCREQGPL